MFLLRKDASDTAPWFRFGDRWIEGTEMATRFHTREDADAIRDLLGEGVVYREQTEDEMAAKLLKNSSYGKFGAEPPA